MLAILTSHKKNNMKPMNANALDATANDETVSRLLSFLLVL